MSDNTDARPRGEEQQEYRFATPRGPIFGTQAKCVDSALETAESMLPHWSRDDLKLVEVR